MFFLRPRIWEEAAETRQRSRRDPLVQEQHAITVDHPHIG